MNDLPCAIAQHLHLDVSGYHIPASSYVVAKVDDVLNRDDAAGLDEVKKSLDLKPFRQLIAGDDKDNGEFFDSSIASSFVALAYHEAKQR